MQTFSGLGLISKHLRPTAARIAEDGLVAVWSTNTAFTANSPIPGVATLTNSFVVSGPVDTNVFVFTMSVTPATETASAGVASSVTATVTLTNLSNVLAEVITNAVMVIGPDTANVTASLSSTYASPPAGGTATLTLTIANNGYGLPGTYEVIIGATNNDFLQNSPLPGVALTTNTYILQPAPPSIQAVNLSGATLTLTGVNAVSNGSCVVLASTNLALPLAQWTPVMTNTVGVNGRFNVSLGLANTLDPNAAQQFFICAFSAGATVTAPTFMPPAAPYSSEQAVTISSTTSGASIRYTTDGTTPSATVGMTYTGSVTILGPVVTNLSGTFSNASGVTMLKAIAFKSGLPDSPVFTGNYQIMVPPPDASSSPLRGIAHLAYRVTSIA